MMCSTNCQHSMNGVCCAPKEIRIGCEARWEDDSQKAKADAGKLQLTLVPRQIIKDIAEVRMYGNRKYHDPNNWRNVSKERYRDAAYRHFLAYLDDPQGVDQESGIPHLRHLACNIAFLCELEHEDESKQDTTL